jgi:hypothetical protein
MVLTPPVCTARTSSGVRTPIPGRRPLPHEIAWAGPMVTSGAGWQVSGSGEMSSPGPALPLRSRAMSHSLMLWVHASTLAGAPGRGPPSTEGHQQQPRTPQPHAQWRVKELSPQRTCTPPCHVSLCHGSPPCPPNQLLTLVPRLAAPGERAAQPKCRVFRGQRGTVLIFLNAPASSPRRRVLRDRSHPTCAPAPQHASAPSLPQ